MDHAHLIVSQLLEDVTVPTLLALGPGLHADGHILTAETPDEMFTKLLPRLEGHAHIDPKAPINDTVNSLLEQGYSFVMATSDGKISSWTRGDKPLKSRFLQKYFSLTTATKVRVGTDYPRTDRVVSGAGAAAGTAKTDQAEILSFGGIEHPPGGTITRAAIDSTRIARGLEAGLRYVIRQPGNSKLIVAAGTPFEAKEAAAVRAHYRATARTPVIWYAGSLSMKHEVPLGSVPGFSSAPVEKGMATPLPKGL